MSELNNLPTLHTVVYHLPETVILYGTPTVAGCLPDEEKFLSLRPSN
jgi:hypothetical protein